MLYYAELGLMGEYYSGVSKNLDIKSVSTALFTLTDALETIKAEILQKYGVEL